MKLIKLIFIGDVMGKLGRKALAKIVPKWREKYQPDEFIVNIENLAHGKGVTAATLEELLPLGLRIFTGGNHIWSKGGVNQLLVDKRFTLVVPANDSRVESGCGARVIEVGGNQLLLVNLVGQVFMTDPEVVVVNPFIALDEILRANDSKVKNIIVDFHAEATSEKVAFGWYADGRVTAVCGTHTHVPTADAKILPKGTAYVTDVGMVGGVETVLGVKKDIIVNRFSQQDKMSFDFPDAGPAEINAVLLEFNPATGRASHIERLQENVVL